MRQRVAVGAGVAILAAILGMTGLMADQGKPASTSSDDESKIQTGFAIAPVPLDLRGKNRAMVGLGSYIVNAQGACNDCHTAPSFKPGGNPHFGEPKVINTDCYLAGGATFGPFTSANITPDSEGRPAGLTRAEFLTLIRTGVDPDPPAGHPPLLQVMPWPVYQDMTDRDLGAIYEYLTSIPSVQPRPAFCGTA